MQSSCMLRFVVKPLSVLVITLGCCITTLADETDNSIAQHRMGSIHINAPAGTPVHVEQLRHEFWFGAALSSGAFGDREPEASDEKYRQVFLENFNAAVTENALKWHSMERRPDQVDYATVDNMLRWTDQHNLPLRGHNLYWGIPNRVQNWIKELNDEQLHNTLKKRGLTIARRYRGRFAEYDLNNEMIHGNYYADRLGAEITRQMADWVKQEDPDAVLYLNDYDILTGNRLDDFVEHIETLLRDGVKIDGIGVQGHLHSDRFDPQALKNALDRLARFELPIRITEFNMPGQRWKYYGDRKVQLTPEQEQQKADQLVEYYRICFAHPAVEGILMWGFWEGACWIPQSALYKKDWTPTPAAEAYRDLVYRKWWTDWQGKADTNSRCVVPAYFGTYRVTIGDKPILVELSANEKTLTLPLVH
ncbi:endo-1,4-beta-xylanase [Novipirellula artificiosorum]|uniref:Beta-xylanase n=1 Tax=Novipirellula artificiosorum TaxID=2528016 RepID=A0A5C6D889_9BACT|nr:endo-1,4-beta-xylanase [Novipirellula artificiosorum]TWU31971.1 Endo-1,4-beta-xylanase Z precursor [Novipirellula artificiosorum]